MIAKQDFCRWFNSSFWSAFKNVAFPIKIPVDAKGRTALVESVYESITSARYSPSIPEAELFINKGNGVTRTVPVLCIQDYCVYYFCIKELEDVLCVNRTPNTFGGWSLGGRFRRQEDLEIESELTDYGRYSFNPKAWNKAFGEFNAILFSQLEKGTYTYALQFDLSNFYDSVRLDVLERWIREEASSHKGWIVTLLFFLLNQWNRSNTGLHPQVVGLPQDALADCSRILANFYLQKYDKFAHSVCTSRGSLYLRYSDDQVILTNDQQSIETLLLLLTRQLDRYGLRVNQKKVEFRTAAELETHRCRKVQAIFSEKDDNRNPALVERFATQYLDIGTEELAKSWNGGQPLLNRLLFAHLESLPQPIFEKLVSRFLSDDFLCRVRSQQLLRVTKLAQISQRSALLLSNISRLINNSVHNALHYEVRAYAVEASLAQLEILCEERLKAIEDLLKLAEKPDTKSVAR
jgi:hypothetical protein